jgi:hypothetical protein
MNDEIYAFDRDALVRAANKRGWDAKTLASFSQIHIGSVKRLLGEAYPKDMKESRRDKVRGMTAPAQESPGPATGPAKERTRRLAFSEADGRRSAWALAGIAGCGAGFAGCG